jgi:hypothetical protein
MNHYSSITTAHFSFLLFVAPANLIGFSSSAQSLDLSKSKEAVTELAVLA